MKKQAFNRRLFLRGATTLGAVGLAMPLLPSLSRAADLDFPRRLVIFFSGNGTIAPSWRPRSENGRLTGLSTILEPLAPHIEDITVVEGLDIECAKSRWQPSSSFHAHERGLGGILTGTHLQKGQMEAESGYPAGGSVDQFLADALAADPNTATALHSLQIGIGTRRNGAGWYNRDTMSYAGVDDPRFHERDGGRLFNMIFGDVDATSQAYERIRRRRVSVLDFLKEDLAKVDRRLSSDDRLRVRQHTEAFRDLERQLSEVVTCQAPSGLGDLDARSDGFWLSSGNIPTIADIQIKQAVAALGCGRTSVATIQFGGGLGALNLDCAGFPGESWHALSHEGDNNQSAQDKLTQMNRYAASRFAMLLDEMKRVPEGDGTLLDHSVVLWVNELGKGNNHEHHDMPLIMAGRLGGFFKKGGRHVVYDRRNTNDLLVTLCRAFGHDEVTTFGIPELCSGPLTELMA